MEMSRAYLEETVAAFTSRGWTEAVETERVGDAGDKDSFVRTQWRLDRPDKVFVLELVDHATEGERYFLEIVGFHGLRTYSLELDSWKHRPDRIEFKYLAHPELGMGPYFILDWPQEPSS